LPVLYVNSSPWLRMPIDATVRRDQTPSSPSSTAITDEVPRSNTSKTSRVLLLLFVVVVLDDSTGILTFRMDRGRSTETGSAAAQKPGAKTEFSNEDEVHRLLVILYSREGESGCYCLLAEVECKQSVYRRQRMWEESAVSVKIVFAY
jgi:hypothetical protein